MNRQPAHRGRGVTTDRRSRHATPSRRRASAPVFVDVTGRRRRIARQLALIAGLLLAGYLGVVGMGLLTGADAPLTPWPARVQHPPDAGGGRAKPTSEASRATPRAGGPAEPSPRPGVTRTAASGPGTAISSGTTPRPTATISHPGNSHATPRANGRTRAPSPKKT